jgi:hypothetical protein
MSRIVMMTSATAALLISSTALAWSWEAGSRLTLVTSNGERIIGVGAVGDGQLAMTISSGFSGFAVLVVEGVSGSLATFDVVVDADGSILISENGDFQDLRESVAEAGLGYRVAAEVAAEASGQAASDEGRAEVSAGAVAGLARAIQMADEHAEYALELASEMVGRVRELGGKASSGAKTESEVDVDVESAGIGAAVDLRVSAGSLVGNGRD